LFHCFIAQLLSRNLTQDVIIMPTMKQWSNRTISSLADKR